MKIAQDTSVPSRAKADPFSDSEIQKIAQDVLHGMQYSFLAAAANQDKPFAAGSVEECLRKAIAARKPERRAVYLSKAREIAALSPDLRQAQFGRFGALSVDEFGSLGLAQSTMRLAPLQLDLAKLKLAVNQIVAANVPAPMPARKVVAGPGPIAALQPHTFGSGAPTVSTIGFYITEVRCVDETDPEIGHDEISVGGLAIDESGNTIKLAPSSVSEYFVENAGTAVYPNVNHDVSIVKFAAPGKRMFSFDASKMTHWPKSYAAVLTLAEIDDGGFSDFLNDAWQAAAPTVKSLIENALAAAGAAFGAIGALIGKVLGKILGWLVDLFVGWIIDLFKDDISAPGTALVTLDSPEGAAYFNSNGWHNFATTDGQFDFRWAGGEYTVRCHWQVEVPGYQLDNQKFQGHYVGVFGAGNDAHAFWVGDWNSFVAKWQELSSANLRLVDLDTYLDGNTRMYAGVFRAGTDAHALWVGADWVSFETEWKKLSGQGLRLTDLQTYFDGGKRLYAGVFRAGTDAYSLWVGLDWASFTAKWDAESKRGLRLVDISSYAEGGQRLFNGVFRAGNDGHALWASDWAGFTAKWKELSQAGLRLIDLDTYVENGQRMFVGVFRAGTGGYLLWDGDWTSFIAKWKEASQQGLRLIDVACY